MSDPVGDRSVVSSATGFLLDLDGTVYLGDHLLPGAAEFVRALARHHRKWLFITNNCSRTPCEYARKLSQLGIPTRASGVFTSGELAGRYLVGQGIHRAFVLGTPSLRRQLRALGVVHTADSPQAVLSSFDKTLTYGKLLTAVALVRSGLPFYSTHPDLVCPTPDGPIPDSGLITQMIEKTTGRSARYLGKPMVEMVEGAAARMGLAKEGLVFIGDRLYTDVRMAREAGIGSVLVLSGETNRAMLAESPWQPHLVADGLHELVKLL
ncbi:MAG: HAD-IIA family hydrolase [Candidatus Brocadiia bacterium]